MKYFKEFNSHAEYTAYIESEDAILPNMSYCNDVEDIHFNHWTDPKLVCKYNITDISSPTALWTEYEPNMFKSMEIDGVLLDSLVTEYQFSTTGEHTVKYELYDETKVGNSAPLFFNITTLSSVSIPNSVTTIDTNAFNSCKGLTSITIPNSVTTISTSAFRGCTSLTSVTIGNSVTSIGQNAFNNCRGLTNITIPDNVTTISVSCFESCSSLTNVTIGNGVTSIGDGAFSVCEGLKNIIIPNSVTSIGDSAFYYCTGLKSITIPNSVTTIGDNAFLGCTNLTSIKVDSGNTVYDSRNNCNAIIETETNTLIQGCQNTVIPNNITTIGIFAFADCTGLTSVTIPNNVTSIGNDAFSDCTGLTSITSLATTAPTINSNTFINVKSGGTLYVPTGSTGYDVWMGTGDFYLGQCGWTMVEQ